MNYIEKFNLFNKQENLIEKNDKILIALSGGPDSMFLLHLLSEMKEQYNLKIIVAHIDHSDREGTEDDAEFVKEYMKMNNIELKFTKLDLSIEKGNLHDVGRKKRYEFLYEVAKKHDINKIALGHHADDLVETILFRLARGSRIKGYGGLRPKLAVNNVYLIRPLLIFEKDEISEMCEQENIPYAIDPTNSTNAYVRNRLRQDVLPVLKNEFSDLAQKYLLFSNRLNDCVDYAMLNANLEIQKNIKYGTKDNMYVNVDDFLSLNEFVQEQLIFYLVNHATNNCLELNHKQITQIKNIVRTGKSNMQVTLSDNIIFIKEYEKISVINTNTNKYNINHTTIASAGTYKITENLVLEVEETDTIDVKQAINYTKVYFSKEDVSFPFTVRNKMDGDKINTIAGNKKVKKVFIDSKVPISERATVPLLISHDDDILWIKDLALSYNAKMKNKTENCKYIAFKYTQKNEE